MNSRKSYDTRIKYLARKGLLPERYKNEIHRSLISKWKQEPKEKYVGYQLLVSNSVTAIKGEQQRAT